MIAIYFGCIWHYPFCFAVLWDFMCKSNKRLKQNKTKTLGNHLWRRAANMMTRQDTVANSGVTSILTVKLKIKQKRTKSVRSVYFLFIFFLYLKMMTSNTIRLLRKTWNETTFCFLFARQSDIVLLINWFDVFGDFSEG